MRTTQRRISVVEWERRPETNHIEELILGEVIVSPEPTLDHQSAALELASQLKAWAKQSGAGHVFIAPVGVRLAWDTVLEPDVLFVAAARSELLSPRAVLGPPDLCIEVLSPSTERRDRGQKLELYQRHGVAEYWLVDLKSRAIEQYFLESERFVLARQWRSGESITSPRLPGFSLAVDEVF